MILTSALGLGEYHFFGLINRGVVGFLKVVRSRDAKCRRHEGGEPERGYSPFVRGVRVISPENLVGFIININITSSVSNGLVINITSPLETLYLISINLCLILTFMQTLLSHEIVKIPNLFILQPVI